MSCVQSNTILLKQYVVSLLVLTFICLHLPLRSPPSPSAFVQAASSPYLTTVIPASQCTVASDLMLLRGDQFVSCSNNGGSNNSLWRIPADSSIPAYQVSKDYESSLLYMADERSGYIFSVMSTPGDQAIIHTLNFYSVNGGYTPPPFALNSSVPVATCDQLGRVPNLDPSPAQDFNVSVYVSCVLRGKRQVILVAQDILSPTPKTRVEIPLASTCDTNRFPASDSDGTNIMISCVANEYYCMPIVDVAVYNVSIQSRFDIVLRRFSYFGDNDELYIVCPDTAIYKVQHPCDMKAKNISVVVSANDCVGLDSVQFDSDRSSGALIYSCFSSGKYLSSPLYPQPILIASLRQCPPPGFFASFMTYHKGMLTITCSTGILSLYPGAYSDVLLPSHCSYPLDLVINTVTGDLFEACYRDSPIARIRDAQYVPIVSSDDCYSAMSVVVDSETNTEVFSCIYPSDTFRVSSDGVGSTGLELVISGDDCEFATLFPDTPRRKMYAYCSDTSIMVVDLDTLEKHTIFPGGICEYLLEVMYMEPYVYVSCGDSGLFAANDTSATPTYHMVLSNSTGCYFALLSAHPPSNTLFITCNQGVFKYNPTIGASSFQPVLLNTATCSATGVKVFGDELVVICNFLNLFAYPVSSFTTNAVSIASRPISSECQVTVSSYAKDPRTEAFYTDCNDAGISVSGLNFACFSGYEWRLGSCEQCSVGKYRNREQIVAQQTECQLCPMGTVAPTLGLTSCQDCQPGYYQVSPYIACKPCGIGSYSSDSRVSECSPCGSGFFGNASLQTSSNCTGICSAGYWCNEGSTKPTQMPCGSASVYCPPGSGEPLPVGAGYYGTNPVIPGTANTQTSRQQCEIGLYCDGSGTARPCPPGRFANVSATEVCNLCDVGKWSDGIRRNADGTIVVDPTTGESVQGAITCEQCAAGSYTAHTGTIICTLCSPGTSQSKTGSTACEDCAAGRSAPESGMSICPLCAAGRSASDVHSISCSLCSPGRYAPNNGSQSCTTCDPGYASLDFGAVQCDICGPGRYSEAGAAGSGCQKCAQGSASNATGLGHVCPLCPPGSSQSDPGQVICEPCAPKKYSTNSGSLQCAPCPTVTNVERTTCSTSPCDAEYEYNSDTGVCDACSLSLTSSKGGSCSVCPTNTYTPAVGSGCKSCSGMDGLSCNFGRITVENGYWAYLEYDDDSTYMMYHAAKCAYEDSCKKTLLQAEFFQNQTAIALGLQIPVTHSPQCQYPRLDSTDNIFCGGCVDGYLPQGDSCVECKEANGGLLFLYFILSIVLVVFLYRSAASESSAGHSVVLMYFAQTAMLEVGPVKSFLQWMKVVNFNGTSGTGSNCLAPMNAYEQYLVSVLMPLFLLCELVVIAFIHRAIYAFVKSTPRLQDDVSALPLSQRVLISLSDFQWSRYVGGSLSILLFCYTQATTSCIRFLYCIDVGDSSVVFTDPTINCRSSEYKRYLIPIVLGVVFYVILFPLLAFAFLLSRRRGFSDRAVRQRTISEVESRGASMSVDANAPDASFLTPSFFMRYGILFQAFSVHAWYYQVVVLLRRAVFVILSVLLTEAAAARGLSFVILNIVAMCLHTYIKPFANPDVNRSESLSTLVLLIISAIITAYTPPYPLGTQVILFLLIVPTVIFLALQVIKQNAATIQKQLQRSLSKRGSVESNENNGDLHNDDKPVTSVSSHQVIRSPISRQMTGESLEQGGSVRPIANAIELVEMNPEASVVVDDFHATTQLSTAQSHAAPNGTSTDGQLMPEGVTSDQYEL